MKVSLRIKMAMVMLLMVVIAFGGYVFLNMVFQEKYYISSKEDSLRMMYNTMNKNIEEGKEITVENRMNMISLCEDNSITVIVVDSGLMMRFYSGYSMFQDSLINRLKEIIFLNDTKNDNIIAQTDEYIIDRYYDSDNGHEYIGMYGSLESGDMFVMRTSIDSMKASIRISNQFALYIGALMIAICVICVLIFSIGLSFRIERLAYISTEMSKLNFNVKYEDNSQDEISQLGNNMNILSEKLESTISELKTTNNKLKCEIKKKEEIDDMRKEFISNVSHELKTPIAIIQGYAEGLKDCVNEDADSREFYCDVIMDESYKMNNMVRKLITLNQMEFGENKAEMERFDIVTVIDQILNKFKVIIENKNARILFDNQHKVYVWADEFMTEEVVTNYLSNALNHLSGKNVITIKVMEENDRVRCSVTNTGENIPEQDLTRIWDKFYKVDKARTREYGGSGIGLSIVKAVMESMNGNYGVYNTEDGVEFWFEVEKGQINEKNIQ